MPTPHRSLSEDLGLRGATVLRVRSVTHRRRHPSLFFLLAFALACSACGRKATRADCEAVVDKNVEVKLKAEGITDPAIVQKRKEELRASLRDDIDKCVGKRITDGMMACVKGAETAEQIDKCLK